VNNDIKILLNEYIETVNNVCILLLKAFYLKSKEDLYKYRICHQAGEFYLDGKNEYVFHGRGCRFKNDNIIIDWDFGYDDEWCRIDPYKFYNFIIDNNKITFEKISIKYLLNEFANALAQKELIKKYDLYYIT
jgi:hypothetical protein